MAWEHRIQKRTYNGETMYMIVEAVFDDDDTLMGTHEPFLTGDTLEEMELLISRMKDALSKPILGE